MRVELLPSLLAHTPTEFRVRRQRIEPLKRTIHLDIMDGQFVPHRSIGPKFLVNQQFQRPIEIHAMVSRPLDWIGAFSPLRIRRVILPVEIGDQFRPMLAWLRSRHIEAGLSINPDSRLGLVRALAPYVRSIQIMGVYPGKYGAQFQSSCLRRLRLLRQWFPNKLLACDGGLNARTIPAVVQAGARRLVIGSELQRAANPGRELRALEHIAQPTLTMVH